MGEMLTGLFGGGGSTPTPAPVTGGGGGGFLEGIKDFIGGSGGSSLPVPGVAGGMFDPTTGVSVSPGGTTPLPSGGTPPFFPGPAGGGVGVPGPAGGGGGFNLDNILGLFNKGTGLLSTIMALKGAFTQSPYEKLGENMISASNKALKAYTSGKLTTSQQAAVDQFKRQEMARWQQYLASAGIPASSAMVDIQNKIDMDAQVYANQLLEQDFKNALAAMQAGGQVDAASQAALSRVGAATNRLP